MNTTYILILALIVILVLSTWLIPRVFNKSSDRLVKKIPELGSFLPEERGKIWLEAISETLMQWPVIIGFLLVMGIAAGLIISLNDLIPDRWDKPIIFLIIFLLFIAVRPFIIHRAQKLLVSKLNNINKSK